MDGRAVASQMKNKSHNRLKAVDLPHLECGYYHDGGGLYLQVQDRRCDYRFWVFRYCRQGKHHMMSLGPLHTVSLHDARAKAKEARRLLYVGIDPMEARGKGRL
jgi:hypothetical protein